MTNTNQSSEVRDFFNDISSTYRDKYTTDQKFHHYFFIERLEESTRDIDFSHRSVLDIGAGTGNLYDYLMERYEDIDYCACDIAGDMLAQSNIPPQDYHVGNSYEAPFSQENFDYIFMLGVTTYMDQKTLQKNLDLIHKKLTPISGRAIITFTNRITLDQGMRKLLKKPLSLVFPKKNVLTSSFTIYPQTPKEAIDLVSKQFEVDKITYLNQTIFPFSRLLPGPSIHVARWMQKNLPNNSTKSLLSSDFILFIKKK